MTFQAAQTSLLQPKTSQTTIAEKQELPLTPKQTKKLLYKDVIPENNNNDAIPEIQENPNRKYTRKVHKAPAKTKKAKKPTSSETSIPATKKTSNSFLEGDLLQIMKSTKNDMNEISIAEVFNAVQKAMEYKSCPRDIIIWNYLKKLNEKGIIIMDFPKRKSKNSDDTESCFYLIYTHQNIFVTHYL